MDYEFLHPGAFPMLKVRLRDGESIKAESGAMIAMTATVDVEGKADGGILKGLGRMMAGESFFFQTLAARRGPGEVLLAHAVPGDIYPVELDGERDYIVQKDGFFAGTSGISVSAKVQSLTKGLFSGEGFVVLRIGGAGTLFVSSYGAIHPIDVEDGEEIVIDNAHLVGWPDGMKYAIQKASSGWLSSLKSGEGLVCRFTGPGRVLIQTRNPGAFGSWVRQFVPSK